MARSVLVPIASLLFLTACGQDRPPPAAGAPEPAPAAPAPKPSAEPEAPSPCAMAAPQTIEIEAGVVKETPWGLTLTYAIDEDKKRGPGYMFLLKHGSRRWETRRDDSNWTAELTWRGFCWKGGPRPEKRASRLAIHMGPVCKDGKLVEMGGCGDTLAHLK